MRVLREAYEHCQRLLGPTHPKAADVSCALAHALIMLNELDEAEMLIDNSLDIYRLSKGRGHPHYLMARWRLAMLRVHQGRFDDAFNIVQEALPRIRHKLGDDSTALAGLMLDASNLYLYKGDCDTAEALAREAVRLCDRKVGNRHPHRAAMLAGLARALIGQNKDREAEEIARRSIEILDALRPDQQHWRLSIRSVVGSSLAGQGSYPEAEELLLTGYRQLRISLGEKSIYTVVALERVIDLYELWSKPEKAAEYRSLRTMNNPPIVRRSSKRHQQAEPALHLKGASNCLGPHDNGATQGTSRP